ncbi:hypothetical protein OG874_00440 [Nocardia sp. NBC_00565]|uniref:hypothetical protein n=1 Tax=Nocardia sp. NBC_00565 TaxID=2975993 RepID=UPI002E823331|nr:hypothetical protein [Nocardia sp. NBC_00565]WUC03723.1 hypothetical protein OG874_00440 [Nocardia sp. NBC_00565]
MSARENPEHQCRQGRRCKARLRDTEGEFHGMGVERPNSLCRPCEECAFDAIRELDTDYGLLSAEFAEERSIAPDPKVSGSSELPIPIPLGIDTLMTEISEEAARWARRLPGEDPYYVGECLTKICSNLGTIVDMPPRQFTIWAPHPDGGDGFTTTILDGVDGILGLADLHRRAQIILGIVETTTYLRDPCPHCARKALAVSKDQERVTCKGCRIVWDKQHFALLSNVLDFEKQKALVA